MVSNSVGPTFQSPITFVNLLKSCARRMDLHEGSSLHAEVVGHGLLQLNVFISSALVDMYIKFGALAKAQQIFDELRIRDAVTWTTLMRGYAEHGQHENVFVCLEIMKHEKILPDEVTYACILQACGSVGDLTRGEEMHLEIARRQLLQNDVVLGNALIDMYAKCGALSKALEVFNALPVQDIVSWNALITGYAQFGHDQKAMGCLEQMQKKGFSPNAVTFLGILQACGGSGAFDKGSQVHMEIVSTGLLVEHDVLGNALVDMYARCGAFDEAEHVLNNISNRSEVSWTSLIAGCCQYNQHEKALAFYQKMREDGLSSDALTYAWVLKACAGIKDLDKGSAVHADIAKEGLLEGDCVLANALVDMYAKCGAFATAKHIIQKWLIGDIVPWTAVMMGYLHHGHGNEALQCFNVMHKNGIYPDIITLLCILQICGSIGAIQQGWEIHAYIVKQGLLKSEYELGNVLVDMYSKCGEVSKAQLVFDELAFPDVVSWTALMTGYAQVGKHEVVFRLFNRMIEAGIWPNAVTFTVVLNICSDLCLWGQSKTYFEDMSSRFGITYTLEHHTCIVDLFGRAGLFDKAVEMAASIPLSGDVPLWLAVLQSCRRWENQDFAGAVFKNIQLSNTASYKENFDLGIVK